MGRSIMRGEHGRVAPNVLGLGRLARGDDLPMQGALVLGLLGGAPNAGRARLRSRGHAPAPRVGVGAGRPSTGFGRVGDGGGGRRSIGGADGVVAPVAERVGTGATGTAASPRTCIAVGARLRGNRLPQPPPPPPAPSRDPSPSGSRGTRRRGARGPGVRAALALARLVLSTRLACSAQRVLAPTRERNRPRRGMRRFRWRRFRLATRSWAGGVHAGPAHAGRPHTGTRVGAGR